MMMLQPPVRQDMIPLARVIEFTCQKAYTDLNLLSELLHSKNDMERKIELVKYLSRVRYTLIRLLALVKWASGAGRVDQCDQIIAYLEEQSGLMFGTANWLMELAKGALTSARLPPFATIMAVDVFTQHTYTRLPACVKRLAGIPPAPIKPWEQRECLEQLDCLILYRLTITEIPTAMRQIKVYNGRAVLTVPHEFSVSLTLMSDSLSNPWRILNIKCLLRDLHTGRGKPLVHPLQMQWLHQRCQDRIISKDFDPRPPLVHLYDMLHSFCTFLQLDLLYEQACRLIRLRFGDLLAVEKYTAGSSLQLVYWRDLRRPATAGYRVRGHGLRLHTDPLDARRPICVTHFPDLPDSDATSIGRCIRSDELSLERLLDRTIQCRCRDLLYRAYKLLALLVAEPPARSAESLTLSLLQPAATHERLSIGVNAYRGLYSVRLPASGAGHVRTWPSWRTVSTKISRPFAGSPWL
uniref:Mediator of RNA polymerase II transcription subunit 14 n=1 Tax=Macrostomum lignano TaxID=282301 RepID=A0A1I8GGM9_9PLAT